MKNKTLSIDYQICSLEELDEREQRLIESAKRATYNSYAKYSNFYVGAALLLSDGTEIIGANQENAAFPSGTCAERSAIFAAQAWHPDLRIDVLAIAARNVNGFLTAPITPCGACRQVILEIEDRYKSPVRILLYGTDGVYVFGSVKDLLPFSFADADMKG